MLMCGTAIAEILVSSIDRDSERAFAMQRKFVADMMESVPSDARRKLSGSTFPRA
jgi:hypothetical protein